MVSHSQGADRRVLVLGAGGFLGRHIVYRLIGSRWDVRALDLHKPDWVDRNIEWIVGSVLDHGLVSSIAGNCAKIIYLAASSLPGSADADMATEVDAHVRMAVKTAEICCERGAGTFVFASSGGTVYGDQGAQPISENSTTQPLTAYGVSKVAIEYYLYVLSRLRGMRTVCLRISNPFGPHQHAYRNQGFVAAALSASSAGVPVSCWGDGLVVRDFVYVEDVAEAFVLSCSYEGESCPINIGTGEGRTLLDVIETIRKLTGNPLPIEFHRNRAFDVKANVLSVDRAKRLLGWKPRTGFKEGIYKTIVWSQADGVTTS